LTAFLQGEFDALPESSSIKALELPKSMVEYFNKGFFNSLIELEYFRPNLLNCNRRSLIGISNLVSRVFYEDRLVPGRFDPYNEGKIIFLDTKKIAKFEEKKKGTSFYNPIEAVYLVKQFIPLAVKQIKAGGKITDLVIISPYMAQVRWLKKKLRNQLLFNPTIKKQVTPENVDDILNQMVITVDAIQGGQRKIVFVSLVRSNDRNEIGFNNDIRRLNVALSRAQELLIIIGNSAPFLGCPYSDIRQAFLGIIKYIKAKGVYKKLGE
jgi:superfamily I DNA and/or RNA helicase